MIQQQEQEQKHSTTQSERIILYLTVLYCIKRIDDSK